MGEGAVTDRRLDALIARQEIADVLARYCRGIDRCDDALVLSAFHPDATDNHVGRDEPVATRVPRILARARTEAVMTSHNITTTRVEIDGDVAHGEAYLLAIHRFDHGGQLIDWRMAARYLDRFERRVGEWRIAHRTVIYDWQRFDAVVAPPADLEDATFIDRAHHGARDGSDISFQFLRD